MLKAIRLNRLTAEEFARSTHSNPAAYAEHHLRMLAWADRIQRGQPSPACFTPFSRGQAKSAIAERIVGFVGTTGRRGYVVYIQSNQDQADQKIQNIATILEHPFVQGLNPDVGKPAVNKMGTTKGWRRNRLYTSTGFVVDALGMDTAMRGIRVDDQRPDFFVFDDCDDATDSTKIIRRKIETLTKSILPAGAPEATTLIAQNLIHRDSMVNQMLTGRVTALANREVIGPIPALLNFEYDREHRRITSGTPTWEYHNLVQCQKFIDDFGLEAFMSECQHDVGSRQGALWSRSIIRHGPLPMMRRVIVAVDPAVSHGPDSDETGIIAVGSGVDGRVWVLGDESGRWTPEQWTTRAVTLAVQLKASKIVYERNQGYELNASMLRQAKAQVPGSNHIIIEGIPAKGTKAQRAQPVALAYEKDKVSHADGVDLLVLEDQMTSWCPDFDSDSPDRVDALVHGWSTLNREAVRVMKRTEQEPDKENPEGIPSGVFAPTVLQPEMPQDRPRLDRQHGRVFTPGRHLRIPQM